MKTQIQIILFIFLVSNSCFAALNLGSWQKAQHSNMNYLIYVPTSAQGKSSSLMISLHGCAQRAEDLAQLGNWEEAAEENSMVVVLPNVPGRGVVLGCWDYYGKDHTEKNRHNGPLIALTEALLKMPELDIDKKRVFVSGISSGSTQAMVLGCMRPDLFSGMGLSSGPAVGTDISAIHRPNLTSDEVADFCKKLAGSRSSHFASQVTAVVVGDQDFIVNPAHSVLSVQAMQKIYELGEPQDFDLSKLKGSNTRGYGQVFTDERGNKRLSAIVNQGLGHAWPAGNGPGQTQRYVNPHSIHFPAFLGQFFNQHRKTPRPVKK